MNLEDFRLYCLQLPNATEGMPFGEQWLAFKVEGKIFALTNLNHFPAYVSLKCNPPYALTLREKYADVITAGFHLNKKHWNTIKIEALPRALLAHLVWHSWAMVVKNLPQYVQKKYTTTLAKIEKGEEIII